MIDKPYYDSISEGVTTWCGNQAGFIFAVVQITEVSILLYSSRYFYRLHSNRFMGQHTDLVD